MSFKRSLLPVLLVSLGLLAACGKKAPDTGRVLASVNNETITERDYENYLRLRQTQQEPIVDKEKEKQVVLGEMIDRIVLSQYAAENKLDQEPDNYLLMKRVRENILVQAAIRKLLKDSPVTDEDLKKRFQQEVEKTHKTEYKVRHILVKSEDEAKGLVAQIKKGGNFAALAKTKSLDVQTGRNGGDLGWINQGMVVPEFFDGVLALKKGESSAAPVKTDYGFHVIKMDDARPLKIPNFEEFINDKRARANLHRKIQDERVETLAKDLKTKAKVTVN
ncbi:MAG: peptidylprolyl isomerase [Gammaproteobacteria bacterium]|nr:peptidylprolyl isomerase [Gammaproteobacteria bacterium]